MLTKQQIKETQKLLRDKTAQEIIKWALENIGVEKLAFASSLSIEDQVITDMLIKENKKAQIFTLDTGRLPQETYDLIQKTREFYKINYEILFPDEKDVEEMVKELGPNLFYDSIENRKKCCEVRKVRPLRRRLEKVEAWICGLRKEQSVTRHAIEKIEWDDTFGLVKINPISDWSQKDVWDYIKKHKVPYNKLYDKGYTSIGCAPCTRPIKEGEDVRAGRWWWEDPEHKECGLHNKK